ncbi:diguanylate cyclase [Colwelliaceae bacterium BS250]
MLLIDTKKNKYNTGVSRLLTAGFCRLLTHCTKHLFGIVLITVLLFSTLVKADHLSSTEIDLLLVEAIESRSSDRVLLEQSIAKILENEQLLSTSQRENFIYLQAYHLSVTGNQLDAIALHQKIENSTDINIKVRSYTSQLNLYHLLGDYKESNQLVDKLLFTLPKLNDEQYRNLSFEMIGDYYYHLGKHQLALNYFSLINESVLTKTQTCNLKLSKALNYLSIKKLKPSSVGVENTINYCINVGMVLQANVLKLNNALALITDKQYQQAIDSLLRSEKAVITAKFPNHIFALYTLLTTAYTQINNFKQAHYYSELASPYVVYEPKSKYTLILYESLASLYKQEKNYAQALHYLQQVQNIKLAVADLERRKAMAGAMGKHQSAEYTMRLNTLMKKNTQSINTYEKLELENAELTDKLEFSVRNIIILLIIYCLFYALIFVLKMRQQNIINQHNIDPLTGLFSRSYFVDLLAGLVYQDKSLEQHLTLITFSIDNLKTINSQYGYEHGDYILTCMKKTFKKLANKDDVIARTGNDEFSLALVDTSQAQGVKLARHFLQYINELSSHDGKIAYQLGASFGVTDTSLCKYIPKNLLTDANKAALNAKKSGKNKVVAFDLSMTDRTKYEPLSKLKYIFKS